MELRRYGETPYRIAVVHGGPGAPGSAAGLAHGLSQRYNVLEPLQTQASVEAQIKELAQSVKPCGRLILVGHSWGAWLSALCAAQYPEQIEALVLIGCAPLEHKYSERIRERRMLCLSRIHPKLANQYHAIEQALNRVSAQPQVERLLKRLGALCDRADAYCLEGGAEPSAPVQGEIYRKVFSQASALRMQGALAAAFAAIACPIVFMHGAQDPHPLEGIVQPLKFRGISFALYVFDRCGHTPWKETYAKEKFYARLCSTLDAWV